MVTLTEAEQKKRKQTLERTKANHVRFPTNASVHYIVECMIIQLSKQLQMRLQYAKLKVEHGWVRFLLFLWSGG